MVSWVIFAGVPVCFGAEPDVHNPTSLIQNIEKAWTGISTAYSQLQAQAYLDALIANHPERALGSCKTWLDKFPDARGMIIDRLLASKTTNASEFVVAQFKRHYQTGKLASVPSEMFQKGMIPYFSTLSDEQNSYVFAYRIAETVVLLGNPCISEMQTQLGAEPQTRFWALAELDAFLRAESADSALIHLQNVLYSRSSDARNVLLSNPMMQKLDAIFKTNPRTKALMVLYLRQVLLDPYSSVLEFSLAADRINRLDGEWVRNWIDTIDATQKASPKAAGAKSFSVEMLRKSMGEGDK